MSETSFYPEIKRILRVEMTKRSIGYAELVERLKFVGVEENERNLRNKVARGSISAALFVQCLIALECQALDLSGWKIYYDRSTYDPFRDQAEASARAVAAKKV